MSPEEKAERDALALALDMLICIAASHVQEPQPLLIKKEGMKPRSGGDTPLWKTRRKDAA